MAKIFGLEIPDGLEALFAAVLQLKPNGDVDGIGLTLPKTTYRKNLGLRAQSLFVGLESYWDGLNPTQKTGWTTYWGTLDFGSHSGAGGWPGSGYSAFVYFNAPRVRDGLDVQLDPPESYGPNILINGNFDGNADDWQLDYDNPVFTYSGGSVYATSDEFYDGGITQELGSYHNDGLAYDFRFELDMRIIVGAGGDLGFQATVDNSDGGAGYPQLAPPPPASFGSFIHFYEGDTLWQHYTYDGHMGTNDPSDSTSSIRLLWAAYELAHMEVYVDNISLKIKS